MREAATTAAAMRQECESSSDRRSGFIDRFRLASSHNQKTSKKTNSSTGFPMELSLIVPVAKDYGPRS
jgi:hypothetical protein